MRYIFNVNVKCSFSAFYDVRKPIYLVPDRKAAGAAHDVRRHLGWRGQVLMPDYPSGMSDINDMLKGGKGMVLHTFLKEAVLART